MSITQIWTDPCYLLKMLGFWLTAVPFLSAAGPLEALKKCAALVAVNVVYFARAKTEEMHLSRDPVYVAYARWIDEHGLLRWVGRLIPALRYEPPATGDDEREVAAAADRSRPDGDPRAVPGSRR